MGWLCVAGPYKIENRFIENGQAIIYLGIYKIIHQIMQSYT